MPQSVQTQPTDNIIHEYYCQPQPDAEVRTERYSLPRTGPDGMTVVAQVEVHRCVECAAATYDGTPERQLGDAPPMSRPRPLPA